MTALVPELVNAAIDATVSPSDLLRRGLVVGDAWPYLNESTGSVAS